MVKKYGITGRINEERIEELNEVMSEMKRQHPIVLSLEKYIKIFGN